VRGDCATVELNYVCNLSYRPKFYAGRYRDVAQAEYGSRDLHGAWNAGPGTRLDRSRRSGYGSSITGSPCASADKTTR
jgi:hypothetical protein